MKPLARLVIQALFVVFVLPVLYILEPVVRLRFGCLHNQRIGHLAVNTDLFLKERQLYGTPARTYYYFVVWDPANQQLLDMLKRYMNILQNHSAARLYSVVLPILRHTRFWEALPLRDLPLRHHIVNSGKRSLFFTREEEKRGRAILEQMGLGPDDWFVCFASRDLNFLNNWRPHLVENFSKTAFRNCSIENFVAAADYVTSKDGFAIRVGAGVSQRLPETGNPKIIDYASNYRSDFGDIYLLGNCRAFVSAASGITNSSMIFDVPVAMVNGPPYVRAPRTHDLFIPKFIRSLETGELISFPEAHELGFFDYDKNYFVDDLCAERNCELAENTPDDIRDIAADILEARDGLLPAAEIREMQEYFVKKFLVSFYAGNEAGLPGPRFVQKYHDLIVAES